MSALLQGFLLIGPTLHVAAAFVLYRDSCTEPHMRSFPSDARVYMLTTDYPWNYLLEDIPALHHSRRTKWISGLKGGVCFQGGS